MGVNDPGDDWPLWAKLNLITPSVDQWEVWNRKTS